MLMKPNLRAFCAVAITALGVVSSHAAEGLLGGPYTALAFFGDSLSDSGNNKLLFAPAVGPIPTGNTYIPSNLPPYASGTYSNGPVWVTPFAASLGLAGFGLPSFASGNDYAVGGAVTSGNFVYPPSAAQQVNSFLGGVSSLPATGLYVIAIGANDVRDLLAAGPTPGAVALAAGAYATAVGGMVDGLQAKGAQNIIVWNVPDVGKAPAVLSVAGASVVASSVTSTFNQALAARMNGEAGVSIFNAYAFVDAMVANPAAYGLVNVTDACGALVNACSGSLSTSLFYDGIHPTAAGHALIAKAMLAIAVPEPAASVLMGLGLLGLVWMTSLRDSRYRIRSTSRA